MTTSRRSFLHALGTASAMTVLAGCVSARGIRTQSPPLGIQLYMLGNELGSTMEATLRELATIGFREIELPHFYGLEPAVIAAALSRVGLTCPSLHIPLDTVWPGMPTLNEIDAVVAAASTLGATNIVVPLFAFPSRLARPLRPGEDGPDMVAEIGKAMTGDDWQAVAGRLNTAAAALAKANLRLQYHNHNLEFGALPDGQRPFDILLEKTDPDLVGLELDVGWVASAGLDPVAMIEQHAARIRQLHLKDVAAAPANTSMRMTPADIGRGSINWDRVLAAARAARIEHFYVEQEPPFATSRMDAARQAFSHLSRVRAAIR